MDVNLITNASNVLLQSVVESSYNYIRYSNGIQICFDIAAFRIPENLEKCVFTLCKNAIDFPKPFKDAPVLYAMRQGVYETDDVNSGLGYHNISVVEVASSKTCGSVYITVNDRSIHKEKYLQFGYIALGFWK